MWRETGIMHEDEEKEASNRYITTTAHYTKVFAGTKTRKCVPSNYMLMCCRKENFVGTKVP